MNTYEINVLPGGQFFCVEAGGSLLKALRDNGFELDAPCGGNGTCGKCRVLIDGAEQLSCRMIVDQNMTVTMPDRKKTEILTTGFAVQTRADGEDRYVLAIDVGTTTVVAYLLDGRSGTLLAQASCLNPQTRYGADVIARIQYVMQNQTDELRVAILDALKQLTFEAAKKAGITPEEITMATIVGNTAMHHLLLGIDPTALTVPPYMPAVSQAQELPAVGLLPIEKHGTVRVLPNIAGFVGADTVGCMTAVRFDKFEKLTLMIDIGTNGEMVLGDRNRRIACSTAAGPAFEGAKISCGMRGAEGGIDHVYLKDGQISWHVIGEGIAIGLCGSGLLDLVAVLLEMGEICESGYMTEKEYRLGDTSVVLTQKDVRELQLAKGAIRAGIELMCSYLGKTVEQIDAVLLAGAFGNYMDPVSACKIGMIPDILLHKIKPIGNAAGEGARLCALNYGEFTYSQTLANNTEFLELASLTEFQDRFIDCLGFGEGDDDD